MDNFEREKSVKVIPTLIALSVVFLGVPGLIIAAIIGIAYLVIKELVKAKKSAESREDPSVNDLFNNSRQDNDNILEHYSYSPATANHINEDNLKYMSIDRCDDAEHRIEELKDLYKAGIIDKSEYNERVASIK